MQTARSEANSATIAFYSADPPALDTFHSFDPESYALNSCINDSLVALGTSGGIEPALALRWSMASPTEMDFELRQDVRFHNGDPFDADDVVATFRAHFEPTPSPFAPFFGVIAACEKLGPHAVRFVTRVPDALLLRRLLIGAIYPRRVIEQDGRDYFLDHPIGTGPYRLVHFRRGEEILLRRNPEHFAGEATVDELRFPIVRQKEWVDLLQAGDVDLALNLDSHDARRLARHSLGVESRSAALSHWFLLANRGPLADRRVRQALNHAVDKMILVEAAEHGAGTPQRTVATPESIGFNPKVRGYRYSPTRARQLLAEAGYARGFTLRGLVSESSTSIYGAVRGFLSRIGVTLEADVVPRAEWLRRATGSRVDGKPRYSGDFALASFDNPLLHNLFHHFIFLSSKGPFSLTTSPEYDARFMAAATTVGESALEAQRGLEAYARDEALLLFTVQQQVHAAARPGFHVELPASGHFDARSLCSIRRDAEARSQGGLARRVATTEPPGTALETLYEATGQLGVFYLPEQSRLSGVSKRIWGNLVSTEERGWLQTETLIRLVVSQCDASSRLESVLASTDRVGIVGYTLEGEMSFSNAGFADYFGREAGDVRRFLGQTAGQSSWEQIAAAVQREGRWSGPVRLAAEGRPPGAPVELLLNVTASLDRGGEPVGYTLVFNDFSGAEERIRSEAIRLLLENVRIGLCRVNAEGTILPGYSRFCERLFDPSVRIAGAPLWDALGLRQRAADQVSIALDQIFFGALPLEVSLAQLPERVQVGARWLSLAAAAVEDESGRVDSLLLTIADITELRDAEDESRRVRGVLKVRQHGSSFASFVRRFCRSLAELERLAAGSGDELQLEARRQLHTAKGVFAQYDLADLAHQIHCIEDEAVIRAEHLVEVRRSVVALLERNHIHWGITLEQSACGVELDAGELDTLASAVARADDLEVARAAVQSFIERARQRTLSEHLGPTSEACEQHAERLGKLVCFTLQGGEVRVPDRATGLLDALTLLLRNAIDHGIELPADRSSAGKNPVGSVILRARRAPDGLELELSDDGRGIDEPSVRARAEARGLLPPGAPPNLGLDQLLELICNDGLSTAKEVTETAGRGVGMGAVRSAVEALGGMLRLSSRPGLGTTLTLTVPEPPASSFTRASNFGDPRGAAAGEG